MTELEKAAQLKDRIREVFLAHGFTIKEGQTDLKPYVYDAAYALIALLQPATERKGEPVYQICMADSVSISTAWVDVGKEAYDDAGLYPEYRRRTLHTSPLS